MGVNHARVYHEHPSAKLTAVVDSDATRGNAAASRFDCNYYPSIADLLNATQIQAASVAVPTSLHTDVTVQLLNANIHVLIEKPLAPTAAETRRICELARKKGAVLMVGHIERFNPALRKLHEIVNAGALGQITSVITRRVGLAPSRIRDTDVVTDLAVHDIDIANFLMGRQPAHVYANGGRGLLQDRCDFAEIFLNYGTANALISVNWLTPIKIRKLSITGTQGYAELDFVRQELLLYQPPGSNTFDDFRDFMKKYGHDESRQIPIPFSEPLAAEIDHFLHCVAHGTEPSVGCAEALGVMKIVEQIVGRSGNIKA